MITPQMWTEVQKVMKAVTACALNTQQQIESEAAIKGTMGIYSRQPDNSLLARLERMKGEVLSDCLADDAVAEIKRLRTAIDGIKARCDSELTLSG